VALLIELKARQFGSGQRLLPMQHGGHAGPRAVHKQEIELIPAAYVLVVEKVERGKNPFRPKLAKRGKPENIIAKNGLSTARLRNFYSPFFERCLLGSSRL